MNRMRAGVNPRPGADGGRVSPSPGAEVAGVSPVRIPVQPWQACEPQSRCRCGRNNKPRHVQRMQCRRHLSALGRHRRAHVRRSGRLAAWHARHSGSPSPGAGVAGVSPSPGADVGGLGACGTRRDMPPAIPVAHVDGLCRSSSRTRSSRIPEAAPSTCTVGVLTSS